MKTTLFDIETVTSDIDKTNAEVKSTSAKTKEERVKAKLGKAASAVADVIGEVKMGEQIHYASMGEWSSHDLLFHLLKQTGPAKVFIASWSLSETSIRQIIEKVKDGTITELSCVFDWRVKLWRPDYEKSEERTSMTDEEIRQRYVNVV